MLISTHAMAAAAFRVEELGLEKSEATQLAKAIADVADFYPMELDPKVMAWWSLGMAVCMVEGPRAWFLFKKAQMEKAARAKPARQAAPLATVPQPPPGPLAGFPEYVPG